MLANLTLTTLVNLEFGWVKYWQMALNSPKFYPNEILCYTMQCTVVLYNINEMLFTRQLIHNYKHLK